MKTFAAITALIGLVAGLPVADPQTVANDLTNGACKGVTLIVARASTEPGNMGVSMGPTLCAGLKKKFSNDVACQGVGGAYSAGIADNVRPAGTSAGAIEEAKKMFTTAVSKCPNTKIVAAGYSQGSAVMSNAVGTLDEATKGRVLAVALWGYTKNKQNNGGIPNYPKDKVKVWCSASDGVCGGSLLVTVGHFSYVGDRSGADAIDFLAQAVGSF